MVADGSVEVKESVNRPVHPRRKYSVDHMRQNLEAIKDYEAAQEKFKSTVTSNSSEPLTFHVTMSSNNDSFEQLLQAAALAAHDEQIDC
jgi:aconitase A